MAPDVLKDRHGKLWGDVVQLTAEKMAKLATESDRVRPDEMSLIPQLLDHARLVVVQDEGTEREAIAFYAPTAFDPRRWYIIVINVTARNQAYLKTYHTVRANNVASIRSRQPLRRNRKYRILLDNSSDEVAVEAGRGGD